MNIKDIFNAIIGAMTALVDGAKTSDCEERAFTEDERTQFTALEAAGKALKPIVDKLPDEDAAIKAAFEKR